MLYTKILAFTTSNWVCSFSLTKFQLQAAHTPHRSNEDLLLIHDLDWSYSDERQLTTCIATTPPSSSGIHPPQGSLPVVSRQKERVETTGNRVLIECPGIQHGVHARCPVLCCSNMHVLTTHVSFQHRARSNTCASRVVFGTFD